MSNLFGDHNRMLGYALTNDPLEADNGLHYSEEIEELIQKAYRIAHKPKKDSLPRLLKLVNKYPHVPAFKNYLTSYYMAVGNSEKANQANRWLVKEHPNYLYGRLNLAGQYIFEEKFEEAEKLLGKALDLQEMYPDREVFHVGEWLSYLNVSCHYLFAIGNLKAAASRINMANEFLPDHPIVQKLMAHLETAMEYGSERTPKERPYDPAKQTKTSSTFTHPEIKELYRYGADINHDLLKSILELPKASLIEDLKKVLDDSIYRYEYYFENDFDDSQCYFPFHALTLLTELKSENSLDIILGYLTHSYEILDFWFDDFYTEIIWMFIYHLGQDQLPKLKQFEFKLNVNQYSKGTISQALAQIALNQPERKNEVSEWFFEVLTYFLHNAENDDLIDTALIGHMVYEYKTCKGEKLKNLIKQLYEQNLVSEDIAGTFEEFEKDSDDLRHYNPTPYVDIFSLYTHIVEEWERVIETDENYIASLKEEKRIAEEELEATKMELKALKEKAAELGIDTSTNSSRKDQSKVGRNEPCPCGSGKKYKKCCMRI